MSLHDTENIKIALFEELQKVLSADGQVRRLAEERLKCFQVSDGYGVYLAEIVVNQGLDLSLRQLASVMLKQYVESSWCDDKQAVIVVPVHAKKMIKSILPEALYDPNSKIRSVVAYSISTIASYDWPTEWGELFEILVKCLGGNENSIHGAMQVLVEFTYELNSQIADCGPLILSEVYRLFEADQLYSVKTRACAVTILLSVLKSINTHIENKQQVANMVNPVLPQLINGLTVPNGKQSNFALKAEIVRVLTYMIIEMPKFIGPYMEQILPAIWQLLTQMADIYIKVVVNASEESPFEDNEDEDETFKTMILQIFEFVHAIIETKKFRASVETVLTDLIYIIIIYVQMTEEQVDTWAEDIEKFVDDEDEQDVNFSVRVSGQDVLFIIGDIFQEKMLPSLSAALSKHAAVADANRTAGDPNWWKIHEASICAVAAYKPVISSNETLFNLTEYLNMVRNLLESQASPYLNGRCLLTLSRYVDSKIFNPQMLEVLVNKITNAFGLENPNLLKIYATRAVSGVCLNLEAADDERKRVVTAKLGAFFDGIYPMIAASQEMVLALFLETMATMFSFDQTFTAEVSHRAIPLTIAVFLKHHDDRYILELVQDVMKILSQNPYCMQPLQEKLVPDLVNILNMQGESAQPALQDIALNVLETIVKYSSSPLHAVLLESAFPAAVHCVLRTEDHSVMQSGGECLRAYIFNSPEQVCRYKHGEGLNWIMQVTTMLLNPLNTEYTATFIGRLVITIITKAGNYLGEHIDLLLKAVISKMQLVESLSVNMSLVMTFAHLILIQMDAVLNFLSTVPGPTGEPAMNFVLMHWLSRQHLFYGGYERKVSVMALCRLFEYGISTKDPRIVNVQIKEPQKIQTNPGHVQTRSQAATQTQWVNVPVLVKIFKLLLNELLSLREGREAIAEESESDDDESGIEGDVMDRSRNLTALMLGDDDDESNEDDNQMMQELMKDPIFQGDMEETLTKFIQNFCRDEQFNLFKPMLNENDFAMLQSINA